MSKEENLKNRLMECEKIINEAQIGAAKAQKALYEILQNELWKAEFASEADYLKARGYTRGAISHMRSYVDLINELEIPEDQCPSEYAVRALEKKSFAKDRSEIYQTACSFAKKRSAGTITIPTYPDIKKAIKDYCDNQSQEIVLRAIDVKVPADTNFISGILEDAAIFERIKSSQQLLAVLKDFFKKRPIPTTVKAATEKFVQKLHTKENQEFENFFLKKIEQEKGNQDDEK